MQTHAIVVVEAGALDAVILCHSRAIPEERGKRMRAELARRFPNIHERILLTDAAGIVIRSQIDGPGRTAESPPL